MEDEPKKKSLRSEPFTQPMFVFDAAQPSSRPEATQAVASAPSRDSRNADHGGSLVQTTHMFGGLPVRSRVALDPDPEVRGGYAAASFVGVRVVPTAFVGVSSTRSPQPSEPMLEELAAPGPEALAGMSLATCQVLQAPHARALRPEPSVVPLRPSQSNPSQSPALPDLSERGGTPAHPGAPAVAAQHAESTEGSTAPASEHATDSVHGAKAQPAWVAPSASMKVSARSPLFRREALLAYRRGERAASVLRVTSVSRWALLLSLACALALALAVVSFGQVEERSAARGVLRMPFGLQPVVPLIGGTVREVLVSPGAFVSAGQLLVRLDATPLAAEVGEAEQRLLALQAQWKLQSESLKSNFERGLTLTDARIRLLAQRRRNQARRIARRHTQAERMEAPELADVVERTVREQTADALDGAKDELLQLSDGLSELRLQQSASRSEYEQQLASGEQRLRDARARRDAARVLLEQSELHAPIAGKVESLRVHAGQTVQAGEWVARVVRDEAPTSIVAFVAERDAAFLRQGAPANVEIDKLPMGEFGFARARVQRVVGEIAEGSELTAALGETAPQGPHVRVELTLEQSPETRRVRPFLRPGTLVTARIALRDRRLLAIVFEPVRRWLR